MKTEQMKISLIKGNPDNPRLIKDEAFAKLVKSIHDFPEMLDIRPIVINKGNVILGGNMRWKAATEAGLKTVPVIRVDLTPEKEREFVIKDNVSGGEWDWQKLHTEWNVEEVEQWGLPIWKQPVELDMSMLDDDSVDDDIDGMASGVKKAIQIEFEPEHYEEAQALVKHWRDQGGYIGMMLIEKLKDEKEKNQ
jgi:hypothetical protein